MKPHGFMLVHLQQMTQTNVKLFSVVARFPSKTGTTMAARSVTLREWTTMNVFITKRNMQGWQRSNKLQRNLKQIGPPAEIIIDKLQ